MAETFYSSLTTAEIEARLLKVPTIEQTANNAQPKEAGKGLSTNDYTDNEKTQVGKISTIEQTANNAQPKEPGMGLSKNSYTAPQTGTLTPSGTNGSVDISADNTDYTISGELDKLKINSVPSSLQYGSTVKFSTASSGCVLGWTTGIKWTTDEPALEGGKSYVLVVTAIGCTIVEQFTPTPTE